MARDEALLRGAHVLRTGGRAAIARVVAIGIEVFGVVLRARLIEEADQPTLEEILDRAGGRSGGSVPLKSIRSR